MGMCSPLASNKHMSHVHSSEVCKSDNSDVAEVHAMALTEWGCCMLNNHVARGGIAVRLLISRLFASHKNQFYAMQERRDPLISLLGLHYSSIYNTNDVLPNSSLIQPVSYTLVYLCTSGLSWWQALRGNGLNTREYSLTKRGHC